MEIISKNILPRLTLVVMVIALFLSGCADDSKERERLRREAEDMVYGAYMAKDYPRIIALVDSFKPLGSFSEGKACYWLGYAYDRMESELRIARDIQMSMVPSVFPSVEGLDMYASMTPAKEVGGDLYNFVEKGDKLYFCIGDVSGKGVPASLYTDGLNEAENRQQEQYGEDRIIRLMTSHASQNARDIIEALKADVDQFRDGAEQNDDLTMLAFRVT